MLSRVDDGSLGSRATRVACTLLSRAQIGAQFGGPVSGPVPTYPDCEWLIGSDAFLALTVEPGVSFAEATRFVVPLQTVTGIGSAAMIGNNRFLYFTAGGTSFSLLYQLVGDFSSLHSAQLAALARHVVAHRMPRGYVADPKAGRSSQAVPPVYFAGDSTAAGPQWAYVTQYETPAIRALCEYQVGSGLLVPSYFDWARHLLAVTAELHPRLVIYMGSANDGQALLVNGAIAAVGSRAWRQAYGKVVGATMTELLAEGTKVLWIGEPAMQDPTLSAEMQAEDQVVAAEAKSHRGVYWFNPGTVLDGPHGSYAGSLTIGGRLTPVRLDGIHLDIAGSLYLARYIARIVTQMLGAVVGPSTRLSPPTRTAGRLGAPLPAGRAGVAAAQPAAPGPPARRSSTAAASSTIRPTSSATVGSSSITPVTWPAGRMPASSRPSTIAALVSIGRWPPSPPAPGSSRWSGASQRPPAAAGRGRCSSPAAA